ncbi:hypothetical protein CAK95_21990 [Pseudorhodoplanes sinuspersici]|uniref:DUF3572 domain-containing protein n=2 Tax=Pseudorhodoplanes sinuspersici TaxID=1235591 RepID=A0A1W6ZW24_9HYPH|nr:DUF3572 domain-containing protein [Pseudorhodoplanes sinuspersici]ARQ01478.1 hypothetical protein CAK95_21990 [Pseudorhodoplanes sinuspersici]
MANKVKLTHRAAETVAVQALSFIASDPERLGLFLASTGIGPGDIRAAAREPLFLAGVLDHLANNESVMLAFAAETAHEPASILAAREALAGRDWERDTP